MGARKETFKAAVSFLRREKNPFDGHPHSPFTFSPLDSFGPGSLGRGGLSAPRRGERGVRVRDQGGPPPPTPG